MYVCGFLFDTCRDEVLLIEKKRPSWQLGKYNGVGGEVEQRESYKAAMVREFKEETRIVTSESDWVEVVSLHVNNAVNVVFLRSFSNKPIRDLFDRSLHPPTDENLVVFNIDDLDRKQHRLVRGLTWIIPMCLDRGLGVNSCTVIPEISYSNPDQR